MPDKHSKTPAIDDEYKSAIQPVVDNNMRTDILGPHFVRVLENHTPASKAILDLIAKEVGVNPELKKAIKNVIEEHNKESKVKWIDRAVGAIGVILLALVIWGIENLLSLPLHTKP